MKQKLLILNKDPFGYHVDTYKYCQYLRDKYDITYVCIEPTKDRIESFEGVKVIYITNNLPRLLRGIYYTLFCILFTAFFQGKIFVKYFETAGLIKRVLFWKKMILDIRTFSISDDQKIRNHYDTKLIKTAKLFNHVTIISEGLRVKMGIDIAKTSILPLGSDIISNIDKSFSELRLLYVGTLSGRNIEETIKGLKLFLDMYPNNNVTYDIIGSGYSNELDNLETLIEQYCFSDIIKLHGFIPNNKLKPFFDVCNVGISYIPITEFYDNQPPTKTYEYVLSGLFCIATSTISNIEIINKNNGILIKDNPKDYAKALEYILLNKDQNSSAIRETLVEHTWEKIVHNTLIPILNTI